MFISACWVQSDVVGFNVWYLLFFQPQIGFLNDLLFFQPLVGFLNDFSTTSATVNGMSHGALFHYFVILPLPSLSSVFVKVFFQLIVWAILLMIFQIASGCLKDSRFNTHPLAPSFWLKYRFLALNLEWKFLERKFLAHSTTTIHIYWSASIYTDLKNSPFSFENDLIRNFLYWPSNMQFYSMSKETLNYLSLIRTD